MTYQETIDYLFSATPVFQRDGGSAYKPGLETIKAMDRHFAHPHHSYKTIHIGGTNGKGSTSHTLAAILQASGYRVGLFTSPHLVDFRERIRVNGKMIEQDSVVDFVEGAKNLIGELQPSFFELTTMMALDYFRSQAVDVAIIEVGLGGRLDSTNIISPILSVITNISLDHMQYLGDRLEDIAKEKAGIIKANTPVVLGNSGSAEVKTVFTDKACECSAPLIFAEKNGVLQEAILMDIGYLYKTRDWGTIRGELMGLAQVENTTTILTALVELKEQFELTARSVGQGFACVVSLTGLQGRWQTLSKHPRLICDTGHNEAGIALVVKQLECYRYCYSRTHIVLGMANDKDVSAVLNLLPTWAKYYFTQASVNRAMPANELTHLASSLGLEGESYASVRAAVEAARHRASSSDLIFVGGSNFIVSDLLQIFQDLPFNHHNN
ncbi:MAG: folylpolyglutamate synthase/dihydrofolate synthase family protein [Porphyromonadaceae bacterium]|nr:folylpolyglutamate synthase/dihydrofolate synthase family protein [Porphyromonadaceae bacterium]